MWIIIVLAAIAVIAIAAIPVWMFNRFLNNLGGKEQAQPEQQPAERFVSPNGRDVIDTETGEIVRRRKVSQKAAAMVYAENNSDVPLKKQKIRRKTQIRAVITGSFDMDRKDIVAKLNKLGVSVGSVVNGKTQILFDGDHGDEVGDEGATVKYREAIKRGLKVVRPNSAAEIFAHFAK